MIGEKGAKFAVDATQRRPPLPQNWWNTDIVFHALDCTQIKRQPHPGISKFQNHPEVPELRLYGVTAQGHAVVAHVHNVEPYLWIKAPPGWRTELAEEFRKAINRQADPKSQVENTVTRIETHKRESLLGYNGKQKEDFLKLVVQLPGFVPKVKAVVDKEGVAFPALFQGRHAFQTYESNVIFPLRYMVDNKIGGCNWVTIPAGKYIRRERSTSRCQIDIDVSFDHLQAHEPVGEHMTVAPFRILSLDIECMGRKGHFPEPEHDPVIQIANYVSCFSPGGEAPQVSKTIFTLKGCSSIAGSDVFSFDKESDLLLAWSNYFTQMDPDFVTGYNLLGFDLPYLLNRATTLNISYKFSQWAREQGYQVKPVKKTFQSNQMGNREYIDVAIEGRVVVDVMLCIQRDHKLRSYSLNTVSQHFLGEQKEDVHHSIIGDLQEGNDETRRRLAVYCLKDALLPTRLLEKLKIVVNLVEMARVTGVPIPWLLERGQGIKVFSQILRKASIVGLLFPTVEQRGSPDSRTGTFEGATVIQPKTGFYQEAVATLDFASLYPSIMMAHNLCYSTLIKNEDRQNKTINPAAMTLTPSGDAFIKAEVSKGILPQILEELLSARKKAKKDMAESTDPFEVAVLNGRQLALKISANSVYGFTGATVGKLPCLAISRSVTAFGRQMIERTKELVEEHYPYTEVVYGDTDSVMIKCNLPRDTEQEMLEAAMNFGKEAADFVTKEFKRPIKLEFEKVYFPYLLMAKKRYAGLLWTKPTHYDKLDAKGIEAVRRDNCPLVSNIVSSVMNTILIGRSVENAKQYVINVISDLLMNRLDISHLVITKAFSKSEDKYAARQAHIALVERMRKRDAASAPTVGDRVPYVVVKGAKGASICDRAEDPIYVLNNNIPLDVEYYLTNQLEKPLLRIFGPLLPDARVLIKGEHTRCIAKPTPTSGSGAGIARFCKIQLQCLGCKTIIKEGAFCKRCEGKEAELYTKILARRNHSEALFSKVWTQCQRCQGSFHQDVICTSRDCPVFYMRNKVQKDLKEQQDLLDRFGIAMNW